MTAPASPPALVEAVAKGIFEAQHKGLRNCWRWEDSGLDDEHPGARDAYIRDARAALAVIRAAFDAPTAAAISAAVHAREDTGLTSAAIRAAAKEILGEDKP
jgi:hypothetical protein